MNPLGQILLAGRYQVLEKLGQGGMGEVYKGLDTQTEKFVAIKQLRGAISDDKTVIERFRREGQALSDLNHPNIVKMLDMIQQNNEYFLVTEFLGGGDLAQLLRQQGKLPLREALRMGLELADALSRAHHLGIVHRDIKPANVMLADDGTPRLTDFGVAHVASQERLTGTGMAVGTMDYLPPEAVNGEAVDVRADVWSFGVMLYEMLTGERPFVGNTTMQLLSNILTIPAADIREKCPEASPELNELIQQMLQKERNQRIRSARQVGAALEAILEGDESGLRRLQTPSSSSNAAKLEPLADSPTTPGTPMRPRAEASSNNVSMELQLRPNNALLIGLALLAIIIIGAGLFVASGGSLFAAPTVTPSATPEPTATPMPIIGDAPEGYRWERLDELVFLVPAPSVNVPTETIISMNAAIAGNSSLEDLLTVQRSHVTFVNWIALAGMTVMIEDSPIQLPDDVAIERYQLLAEQGGSPPIEEFVVLDMPFGRTLHFASIIPAPEEGAVPSRMEVYATTIGSRIYTFAFVGQEANFENRAEEIETILASAHLEEVVAESTESAAEDVSAEATEISLPNMPEDWKVVVGEHTAYAVPEVFLTTTGANQTLINSSLNLVFGNAESADAASSLFEQMSFDGLAANLRGTDLMFVASIYQESVLSTDLGAAETIVQGMFSILAENEELEYTILSSRRETLPAGEMSVTDTQIIIPERPPMRNIYYLTVREDGTQLYAFAVTFLDSEAERMLPIIEQIAQTFVILD